MPHPVRTTPTRPRSARPPALAGLLLGAVLVVTGCGTRSLTDAATVADRQSAGRLVSLCPAPGEARVVCDAERVEADVVVRRGAVAFSVPPLVDAAAGAAFAANVPAMPAEPATTTAAPTTVAAPPPAAPVAEPAAEAEPAPEEEAEPEETAPPTTRKPKKSNTTAATPAPAPAPPPPDDTTPDETQPPAAPVRVDTSVAGRVVALVNAQRAAAGLGAVSSNGALTSAAAAHSKDQATTNKMSHTGSNGSSMSQRCSAAGYGWRALAENVAAGYGSADSVMNGWMSSAGHKANILNPSFVHIGVAVAYSANGTAYWTMDLGAPG